MNQSAPKEKAITRSAQLASCAKALSHTTPYLMVMTLTSTANSATIENSRLLGIEELGVLTGLTMSPQVFSDIHSKLSKFSGLSCVNYSSLTFQGFLSFPPNVNISLFRISPFALIESLRTLHAINFLQILQVSKNSCFFLIQTCLKT